MAEPLLVARAVGTLVTELGRFAADRIAPGGTVPDRPSGITAPWLEGVMDLAPGTLHGVTVVSQDSGTAARARLALDAAPGAEVPTHVFLKLAPRDAQQRVMMNVVGLGAREVLFYRAAAPDVPVRVPRCCGIAVDARRGRNVIVLEDLVGATFRDVREHLDAAQVEAVVDALARLHAAFWGSPRLHGDLAALTPLRASPVMSVLGSTVIRRWVAAPKATAAELVPADVVRKSRVLTDNIEAVDRYWNAQPATLTHGDPHLGNLFFEGAAPGFLDWQVCHRGAGIRDVAYAVTAALEPELARKAERSLLERYVDGLAAAGVKTDIEAQWLAYRAVATEFYVAAVSTASSGERMQSADIMRVGVERAVAAVEALDSFAALSELTGLP